MAHALLSRRAVLGHAMAGAIVAKSTACFSQDRLGLLIERTQAAFSAWVDAHDDQRRLTSDPVEIVERRTTEEWNAAIADLLSYRPKSLQENARRLAYLVGADGPWEGCVPHEWELDLFFASLMPAVQA